MIKIIRLQEAPKAENPHGVDVRKLYDTEHAQAIHITLLPGEKLKKHITPVDVFFYILEGSGLVEIGEEQAGVSAHMLIDSPANIPHRLINNGEAEFRFLVVKVPRPTQTTRLL